MNPEEGREVEVHSRFDGRWVTGFEVAAELSQNLYLLRRRSDGAVLPVPFPAREVRARAS